ncbi:hypothetical protein [Photobacterium sp. GB-56]|uniref:hypothetical protein n=1 Tax=Photobacterium sp. GB-56 TaxID=2022106 RepID=UPI000D185147|nr:hypothetical protein [Photobacterium sp. GB-56]PSV20194.1 hypothetical protein C9J42_21200 [Photobacterium sp. GB-56]
MDISPSLIKTKIIYIPITYLFITTIFMSIFLKWLLEYNLEIFNKSELYQFLNPLIVSIILCFLVMRKRLDILIYKYRINSFVITLLTAFYLSIAIENSQKILPYLHYEIQKIEDFSDLSNIDSKGYLKVQDFNAIKSKMLSKVSFRTRITKSGEVISIYRHISIPLNKQFTVWAVFPFSKDISKDVAIEDKKWALHELKKQSSKVVNGYDFSNVEYFEVVPDSDYRDQYILSIHEKYPRLNGKKLTILSSENRGLDHNLYIDLGFFLIFMVFGAMCIFVLVEFQGLDPAKVRTYYSSEK